MSQPDRSSADEPEPDETPPYGESADPDAQHGEARVVHLSARRRTRSSDRVRVTHVETEPMSPEVEAEVVDLLGVLIDQWATSQQQTSATTATVDRRAA